MCKRTKKVSRPSKRGPKKVSRRGKVRVKPSQLYSVEVRIGLWEDAGKICHYCDRPLPKPGTKGGRATHFDHKVAHSKGGSHDLSNLVVCCKRCNREKGNTDYLAFLQGRREEAMKKVRRLSVLIERHTSGQTEME